MTTHLRTALRLARDLAIALSGHVSRADFDRVVAERDRARLAFANAVETFRTFDDERAARNVDARLVAERDAARAEFVDLDAEAKVQVERLRGIVIACAKAAGAAVSEKSSDELLSHVPEEIRRVVERLTRDRIAAHAELQAANEMSVQRGRHGDETLAGFVERMHSEAHTAYSDAVCALDDVNVPRDGRSVIDRVRLLASTYQARNERIEKLSAELQEAVALMREARAHRAQVMRSSSWLERVNEITGDDQ